MSAQPQKIEAGTNFSGENQQSGGFRQRVKDLLRPTKTKLLTFSALAIGLTGCSYEVTNPFQNPTAPGTIPAATEPATTPIIEATPSYLPPTGNPELGTPVSRTEGVQDGELFKGIGSSGFPLTEFEKQTGSSMAKDYKKNNPGLFGGSQGEKFIAEYNYYKDNSGNRKPVLFLIGKGEYQNHNINGRVVGLVYKDSKNAEVAAFFPFENSGKDFDNDKVVLRMGDESKLPELVTTGNVSPATPTTENPNIIIAGGPITIATFENGEWKLLEAKLPVGGGSSSATEVAPQSQGVEYAPWIQNEKIEADGVSFGFQMGYDKTSLVEQTITSVDEKLAEYAAKHNLPNTPLLEDIGFNKKNPDARQNLAREITTAFLWTYNHQHGTNLSYEDFLKNPDLKFQIWGRGDKVIDLSLNQIKNINIVITSNSTKEKVKKNYMYIGVISPDTFGYDFENGTFTLYTPIDTATTIEDYFFDPNYPLQHPENIVFGLPIKILNYIDIPMYAMPFSVDAKNAKNQDSININQTTKAREEITAAGKNLTFSNKFRNPLFDQYAKDVTAKGLQKGAADFFSELGPQYGTFELQ